MKNFIEKLKNHLSKNSLETQYEQLIQQTELILDKCSSVDFQIAIFTLKNHALYWEIASVKCLKKGFSEAGQEYNNRAKELRDIIEQLQKKTFSQTEKNYLLNYLNILKQELSLLENQKNPKENN